MAGGSGKVYLVGAGPGDPGLITVRGLELLGRADVVVYDRLGAPSLLRSCRPDARLVYVGKEPGGGVSQEDINRLLEEEARAGRTVVRLKGGDPFVFGRGGEEALHLAAAGIPFEVVPGVTSAVGVPAYAGIPLTFRGLSSAVALVSGRLRGDEPEERWRALAAGVDTVVFLMAMGDLEGVLAALLRHGRPPDTPAAVISWGTRARQRTVQGTLATVAALARRAGLRNPAITVVGPVVALRDRLAWFESKPLFGRRILLTRPPDRSGEMAGRLRELGAEVVEAPLIRVVPAEDTAAAAAVLERLASYAWVVFTSANAVEPFFTLLARRGLDARALAGCRVAAVGDATAGALAGHGLRADLVPREARGEALVEPLAALSPPGSRFLLPRGDQARPELPDGLRRLGFQVDEAVVYRTLPDEEGARQAAAALKEGVDAVVLASPSAADSLAAALATGERGLEGARPVAIGPTTAARVRELGLPEPVVARRASAAGVAEAVLAALAAEPTA